MDFTSFPIFPYVAQLEVVHLLWNEFFVNSAKSYFMTSQSLVDIYQSGVFGTDGPRIIVNTTSAMTNEAVDPNPDMSLSQFGVVMLMPLVDARPREFMRLFFGKNGQKVRDMQSKFHLGMTYHIRSEQFPCLIFTFINYENLPLEECIVAFKDILPSVMKMMESAMALSIANHTSTSFGPRGRGGAHRGRGGAHRGSAST
jgi:hypothetical protein